MSTIETCIVDSPNNQWVSTRNGATFPRGPATLGATIYTAADIAAWTIGAEFTALDDRFSAGLRNGDSITDHGTTMDETDMAGERTLGIQIKSQAVLAAVGSSVRNATYVSNVAAWLDGLKDITAWTKPSATGQVVLEGSWLVINAVQCAQISGYSNTAFDTFLRDVCYTEPTYAGTTFGLDWTSGGNWVLAFSVARMHIASYLQDATLWADAVDYFEWHMARSVYHSTYDGANVVPMRDYAIWPTKKTGTITAALMTGQWNFECVNESPTDTWAADYSNHNSPGTWAKAGDMLDGTHCEAKRSADYEHWNCVLACMGGLIAHNVGYTLSVDTKARIDALVLYASARIWAYEDTATTPTNPVWQGGVGTGDQRNRGWHVVARYSEVVNGSIPADVASLLPVAAAATQKEGETFHAAAEFADGTLLV